MLPLVERIASGLSGWLAPAYAPDASCGTRASGTTWASEGAPKSPLELRPDLDTLPALAIERESLWASLEKTSFLTDAEKRTLAGFSPMPGADAKRFNPGQPRVPSGQPGGGQWTNGDGGDGGQGQGPHLVARKPGGIAKELWKLTVRQFVSQYCKGTINEVLPGEFESMTIQEIMDLAKGGDARAKTCKKLLNQGRFRK